MVLHSGNDLAENNVDTCHVHVLQSAEIVSAGGKTAMHIVIFYDVADVFNSSGMTPVGNALVKVDSVKLGPVCRRASSCERVASKNRF